MTVSLSSTVCYTRAVVGNIRGNVLNKLLLVESERKVSFTNISMKHTYVVWQPFRGKPLFRYPDLCHVIQCDVHSTNPPRGIMLGESVCGCGFDNSYVFHIRNHSCNQITLAHVWLTLYQLDIWVCYTLMVVYLWS